jgi:small-conductance mechanosensitive channel
MNDFLNLLGVTDNPSIRGWVSFTIGVVLFSMLMAFIHRLIMRQMDRVANKTNGEFDDILVKKLRRPTLFLFLVFGIFSAVELSDLPLKDMSAVESGIKTAFIIFMIWTVEGFIAGAVQGNMLLKSSSSSTKGMISLIMRIGVFIVGSLMVLDSLGISITPLLASLGVGSLAVALALQDTLSNFFSGLYILADKPFQPGNFIEIETGVQGFVEKVGWRSTHIKTIANNIIVVPNAKAAASVLTNYDMQDPNALVTVDVGVSYSSDLRRVESICLDVGKEMMLNFPQGVPSYSPLVRFREFGDSSINAIVYLRAKSYYDRYLVRHHYVMALHERFRKEGIEIPFPQRVVHMQK